MKITDDLAEGSRCEESAPEGALRVLAHRRQQPQSGSNRCRHVIKLPAELFTCSICPIRRGETGGIGGVCGGAEGMGAHMRDGCGLPGRSSGRKSA